MMKRAISGLLVLLATSQAASPAQEERFEQAYRLVNEYYWDLSSTGKDWPAIGEKYRLRLTEVSTWDELYKLLAQMYGELGDSHSTVLGPEQARALIGEGLCFPLPFPEAWSLATSQAEGASPPEFKANLEQDQILYLRIPNLIQNGPLNRLEDQFQELEPKAKMGIILDLRGNPGGLTLHMARVAGWFTRGALWRIVTRGYGVLPQTTIPLWGTPLTSKPLVILIDQNVNSAAEGLAGALKLSGRGYLIGQQTAGNTEAVIPYCFPDGAVAMVAAGVLAPLAGSTWEGRGVEPDLSPAAGDDPINLARNYLKNLSQKSGTGGGG